MEQPPQHIISTCPAPRSFSRGIPAPSKTSVASLYRTTYGVPILTCPQVEVTGSKIQAQRGCEKDNVTDTLTCTENGLPVVRRRRAKSAPFRAPDRDVETVVTGIRAYPCGKCS